MELNLETRINELLDQLENPNLKSYEIQAVQSKIEFLRSLEE